MAVMEITTIFQKCLDKMPADVKIIFVGMCDPWLNLECTKMVKYALGQYILSWKYG